MHIKIPTMMRTIMQQNAPRGFRPSWTCVETKDLGPTLIDAIIAGITEPTGDFRGPRRLVLAPARAVAAVGNPSPQHHVITPSPHCL